MFKDLKYKNIKPIYKINEYGNIYSMFKNGYMKPRKDKDGYLRIALSGEENTIYVGIATLVIYNFVGEPPKDMKDATVDHIDGNTLNNHYSNLRWLERSENSSIRKKRAKSKGKLNHEAKLNEEQVSAICELLMENAKTLKEIADMFKVHKSTINNIKQKKNWQHVTYKYDFPDRVMRRNEKRKIL